MARARAFTLIEILVVVAILGILISIVMVPLSGARQSSRDARRIADIKNLQLALAFFYNDNLYYPPSLGDLVTGGYLSTLPRDPNSSVACTSGGEDGCYKYNGYRATVGGAVTCNPGLGLPVTYHLGAVLEESTNQGLVDDYDAGFASYGLCNGGHPGTGFSGTSQDCGATAGPPELCYSQKP